MATKPRKKSAAEPSKKKTAAGMISKTQDKGLIKAEGKVLHPIPVESIVKTTQDLMLMGKMASESHFYAGIDTQEKACMVIQTGRELGIMEASACRVIHPIPTQAGPKLAIESKLYAAIAMNLGVRWKIHEKTPEGCKLEFYSITDKTIPNHTETFTMKDAARAKLAGKDNWLWYPEEMCFWRCFLKGVRVFDPRICMGLYSVQEVNDFEKITNGDGEEVYVIPEETLGSVGIPDTDTAPPQTVAQALPAEAEVQTIDKIQEEEMEEMEEEYDDEGEEDLGPSEYDEMETVADVITHTKTEKKEIMPFEEDPTQQEQKPGTRELAPKVPTDPGILIHKQVILDYMKVQGMENMYTTFKEWLAIFQTSRKPMKAFVARNQFGKWSISKGSIEDLKVLTDHLKWTMDTFIGYCFTELKLERVGIHTNPALNAEPA